MKRIAAGLIATLLSSLLVSLPAQAAGAPSLSQVNEPGQVALNGDSNFRGQRDLYQLTPPASGNWDLVGAWNFNNTSNGSEFYEQNNCANGNNSTGNYGPTNNSWGAMEFNAIRSYGNGVSSTLVNRAGTNTGITLTTSIRSPNGANINSGCTTVYKHTDAYGGAVNAAAVVRRTTETINSVSYVYPESFFKIAETVGVVWSNTFSNLNPNNRYRIQFVYSALRPLGERITSKASVAGGTDTLATQDVSAGANDSRHKNRITVEFTGADAYTLTRENLNSTTGMALNAFTIYQERKTPTTTTLSISTSSPSFGDPVTLSATVTPAASGTVSFLDAANTVLCTTGALVSGVASCSWTPADLNVTSVRASYGGDASFAGSVSQDMSVLPGKAPSSTVLTCTDQLYSGSVQQPCTASVTGPGGLNTTTTVIYQNNLNAGTATATAIFPGDATYQESEATPVTFFIQKGMPNFSWSPVAATFGQADFTLDAPSSSTPGTFTYSSSNLQVISTVNDVASVGNAGTATITATFTPNDQSNFVSGSTTEMLITVNRAVLSITASSPRVTFGSPLPTVEPSFSGFVAGDDAGDLAGLTCGASSYTSTSPVASQPQTICSGASASNYTFQYIAGSVSIDKAVPTTPIAVTSTSVRYGSELTLSAAGGDGEGALSFVVDSGPCSLSATTLVSTDIGTCMVTATRAASNNFLESNSPSTPISVNPKILSIEGLYGVSKEFDGSRTGSATGSARLVGVVGVDEVLLSGTPQFTFASSNAATDVSLIASGFGLTGISAYRYALTQPQLFATISPRSLVVTSLNVTTAFGGTVSPTFTSSGLILGDILRDIDFTFSGTSTTTAPTGVGVYTITPSNADFQSGTSQNYRMTYVGSTLTILAKYLVTYDPNGGSLGLNVSPNADYVVGEASLVLPSPSREGFTFKGWFSAQQDGSEVVGPFRPTSSATFWARWTQNSLIGIQGAVKIGSLTTVAGQGILYSANSQRGTVSITYVADSLPSGTAIDIYQMGSPVRAASLISSSNSYVLSLVVAWLTPAQTVPILSSQSPLTMVITDPVIKKGAKVYSLIGNSSSLLGVATNDGSVTVSIYEDPEVYIAITVPDAPTNVVTAASTDSSAQVSWQAPSSNGGAEIATYSVIASTGQSCTTSSLSCTVSGLTNGVTYSFTVTAINAQGSSLPSTASADYVPMALISASPVIAPTSSPQASPSTPPSVPNPVLSLSPTVSPVTPTESAPVSISPSSPPTNRLASYVVTGFAPGSWKLTPAIKAHLKKLFALSLRPKNVTCLGFTMGPTILTRDSLLAIRRGAEICKFVRAEFFPGLPVKAKAVNTTALNSKLRRAVIYLRY